MVTVDIALRATLHLSLAPALCLAVLMGVNPCGTFLMPSTERTRPSALPRVPLR